MRETSLKRICRQLREEPAGDTGRDPGWSCDLPNADERVPSVREDLKAAYRRLGLGQRLLLRQQLKKVESMLDPSETTQILAPGQWRGQPIIAVLTTSRLLLARPEQKQPSTHQAVFARSSISQLSVHPCPPKGARFRLKLGLNLEEFTVTQHGAEFERLLRANQI